MAKAKCLKCGDTLFETVQLDQVGNRALNVDRPHPRLETDPSGQPFMQCPQCGAKNGFRAGGVPDGPAQLVLDRLLD